MIHGINNDLQVHVCSATMPTFVSISFKLVFLQLKDIKLFVRKQKYGILEGLNDHEIFTLILYSG